MSIEEKLCRLGVKVQSFGDTYGGYGALTPQDLAAALSLCNKVGQEVIWRRVMQESLREEGYNEIYSGAWNIVLGKKLIKRPDAPLVAMKILDEALDDYTQQYNCRTCGGKQYVTRGTVTRACPSTGCRDGKRLRTDAERAKSIGVSRSTYSESYRDAYNVINDHLTGILPNAESEAISCLIRYFR